MACEDRQLTEAQRVAGYQNGRTGVQQAVRPFTGRPTVENLIDYINRELYPAVRRTRDKVNDIYLPVVDNAPSGNPLGFYFSAETGAADPTAGRIRLNASPQDTATVMRVSQSNGRLVDVAPWLDVMAGGATTPLGVVTLTDAINPGRFIRFDLTSMLDQGAYWDLSVAVIESSHDDPFVDGGAVVVSFIPGVGGATPATVPGTSISGADGPRQFLSTSTGTAVDFRTLSTIFPGAPIYDVMAYPFSALGTGSGDDIVAINAAIAAANATGGVVYLGLSHRISVGLDPITGSCVVLMGRGQDGGGTTIRCATAPDAIITIGSGSRYSGVANLRVGSLVASTSGHAVRLVDAFRPFALNVRSLDVGNGFEIDRCNTSYLENCDVTQVFGSYGFYVHGVAPDFCHVTRYVRCQVGVGFPLEEAEALGDWAPSTAYTLGQFVRANGGIWQVGVAGTSAGSGTGPSGLPSSVPADVNDTLVTDGSVQWYYSSGAYTGFAHGSFAHSVFYEECGVLHGYYGMHAFDDQGDEPTFIHCYRFSNDKPFQRGIYLEAASAAWFSQTFVTSAMQAAVEIGADCHSWQFHGGQLYAQAREGIIVSGAGGKLVGMEVAGSSTEPSNTYDGVRVDAGVTDFTITGCTIGNVPGRNTGARYCISIGAGCDRYAIVGNNLIGGDTGAILDGTAGRSDTRVIADNLPDTEIAAGSVWGLQIDHGSSDVPREVTKFELGEQIRFATSLPDTASTGTIQTYAVAETTTQVNLQLTTAVVVRGLTIITGKRIVFHFDNGFAGSFTFNHEDASAAATGERIRCPGGVALTMVANDTVVLERFENRWRVVSVVRANAVTDGDKGDVTVSASGTVWTVDANINKNWTGSHTWVSPTFHVTATNDILVETATSGIHLGAGHAVANVGNTDIIANAAGGAGITAGLAVPVDNIATGAVHLEADQLIRLFTGGVERLEIEADGAWQLGGATGTIGHTIVTAGASAPPAWGQLPTAGIADGAVTNAKGADMVQSRLKGRAAGAGTGPPTDLTGGEARTILSESPLATAVTGGTVVASSTTKTAIISLTFGANTLAAGQMWEMVTLCTFQRAGSVTPTDLTVSAELNGSVQTFFTRATDTGNPTTCTFEFRQYFTVDSIGASGTCSFCGTYGENLPLATDPHNVFNASIVSVAIDTTGSNTIRFAAQFSASAAGTSVINRRSFIRRIL